MLSPLRAAGLAHDCGVPSFDAIVSRFEMGSNSCVWTSRIAALQEIAEKIDSDQTLTPSNRKLACAMIVHLAKYSNMTRIITLMVSGIVFILLAILLFALGAGGVGGILLGIGVICIAPWFIICARRRCKEGRLREKEEEALNQMRGLR
jgi:hypothetical protein